jgi:hypothetical protein
MHPLYSAVLDMCCISLASVGLPYFSVFTALLLQRVRSTDAV